MIQDPPPKKKVVDGTEIFTNFHTNEIQLAFTSLAEWIKLGEKKGRVSYMHQFSNQF